MTPERLTYHVGLSQITKDTLPPVYHEVVADLVDVTADRDRLAAELARVRSASESLASLIRLRYPRLLEHGNPLYDATLDAALAQPQDGTTEGEA